VSTPANWKAHSNITQQHKRSGLWKQSQSQSRPHSHVVESLSASPFGVYGNSQEYGGGMSRASSVLRGDIYTVGAVPSQGTGGEADGRQPSRVSARISNMVGFHTGIFSRFLSKSMFCPLEGWPRLFTNISITSQSRSILSFQGRCAILDGNNEQVGGTWLRMENIVVKLSSHSDWSEQTTYPTRFRTSFEHPTQSL
jgi:hypothetical protein